MKFNVSRTDLLRVLNALMKVILKKNAIAVLENVLVTQNGDAFTATSSSQENTLVMPLALTMLEGDFKPFCINPNLVSSFISALPEQPLTFEIDDKLTTARISYQGGEVQITIQSAEDFPRTQPMNAPKVSFELPTDVLLSCCKDAAQSTDHNEIRPVMNAVCLDVTNEGVVFVSSDGRTLYKYVYNHGVPFLKSGGPTELLLPGAVVSALTAPFAGAETVLIQADNNGMEIISGGTCFTIRTIEGKYPPYNAAIPTDNDYHVIMPVKSLKESISRVAVMASIASCMVTLSCEKGQLYLSSIDLDFNHEAKENLPLADVENACNLPDGYKIGMRYDNLRKMLDFVSSDNVRMEFGAPSRAIIMHDETTSPYTGLVMPLIVEA
jgi:DNA polymerase-3 subunit beta